MAVRSHQAWRDKVYGTKNPVINVSQRAFRSTLRKVGVATTKGQKSVTIKGTAPELVKKFAPISKNLPIGRGRTETRYRGLLVSPSAKSVTIRVGRQDSVSSTARATPKFLAAGISQGDNAQFRNFGLRADGSARLGYTLAQCQFSFDYVRGGSLGNYGRYGDGTTKGYNGSTIHRIRVAQGIDKRVSK